MASFIISSAAVTAVSRATPSHASLVVPFNGLKLSNSAAMTQTHVAPFTGLKSNSTFPLSRKVNNITSLTSNGGRARCWDYLDASALKFQDSKSWTNIGEARAFTGQGSITNSAEIDVSKLQKGREYEIIYYVYMKTQQVDGSFSLTLDLPNGTSTVTNLSKVTVTVGDPETPISVGKFRNNYKSGTVTFTFSSDKPNAWEGLVISGVSLIG